MSDGEDAVVTSPHSAPEETNDAARITRNAVRCKRCGTVLESRHDHDFRRCGCGTMVDGGLSYLRRGWQGGNAEDAFEELSEPVSVRSFGKPSLGEPSMAREAATTTASPGSDVGERGLVSSAESKAPAADVATSAPASAPSGSTSLPSLQEVIAASVDRGTSPEPDRARAAELADLREHDNAQRDKGHLAACPQCEKSHADDALIVAALRAYAVDRGHPSPSTTLPEHVVYALRSALDDLTANGQFCFCVPAIPEDIGAAPMCSACMIRSLLCDAGIEPPKRVHRCMRCNQEFECPHGEGCVADYKVLPRVLVNGEWVDHCPMPTPTPSGQPSFPSLDAQEREKIAAALHKHSLTLGYNSAYCPGCGWTYVNVGQPGLVRNMAAEHLTEQVVEALRGLGDSRVAPTTLSDKDRALAWVRDGCPQFPSFGMAGGTKMEADAQDAWVAKYGRRPLDVIRAALPKEG